jgi:hypothetical protein
MPAEGLVLFIGLIVAGQAGRLGIAFGEREHARYRVPVAVATLAVAAARLAIV